MEALAQSFIDFIQSILDWFDRLSQAAVKFAEDFGSIFAPKDAE